MTHCHASTYDGHASTDKIVSKILPHWEDFKNVISGTILGNQYILVAVDYVLKWIKVITHMTNDARVVINVFKKLISPKFGVLG